MENVVGFLKKYSHADFMEIKLDLDPDLQKSITCMETLAQLGYFAFGSTTFPCHQDADQIIILERQYRCRSFNQ